MCGRFQLELSMEDIINLLDVLGEVQERYQSDTLSSLVHEKRDYYPGSYALAATKEGLKEIQWGFPLEKKLIFNARKESLFEKPFFRQAALTDRCVIPATLFYEWQGKEKIKHLIRTEEPLLYMGAVRAKFPKTNGEVEERFSIITTSSEGEMAKIHERTPFILEKEDLKKFLNPAAPQAEIQSILQKNPKRLLIERADPTQQLSFF